MTARPNVPSGLMNVVAIAAGGYHSLALKGDGTVMAWGDDPDGETDVPSGLTNVVAIAAGGHHSLALKGDGTAVGWGFDNDGETDVPSGLTNVVAIAGGGYHSLALGNLPPGITVQPQKSDGGGGRRRDVQCHCLGSSPLNCQWYFNSTKLANATNWTLILSNVSTNNTGGYHIVVTNKLGLVTSSNAALTVNVPPVITQQPVNVTTNTGGGAMFSVMVSTNSTLPLSYQWYFKHGILIDATNATLALTNVQPGQAGIYSAALANVAGSVTSSNAVLTVVTEVNTAPVLPPQFNRTIHGKLLMTVTTRQRIRTFRRIF